MDKINAAWPLVWHRSLRNGTRTQATSIDSGLDSAEHRSGLLFAAKAYGDVFERDIAA